MKFMREIYIFTTTTSMSCMMNLMLYAKSMGSLSFNSRLKRFNCNGISSNSNCESQKCFKFFNAPKHFFMDLMQRLTSLSTKKTIKEYDFLYLLVHMGISLFIVGLVGEISPSQIASQISFKIRVCSIFLDHYGQFSFPLRTTPTIETRKCIFVNKTTSKT